MRHFLKSLFQNSVGFLLALKIISCAPEMPNPKYERAIICGHSDVQSSELQTISIDIIGIADFEILKHSKNYIDFVTSGRGDFKFEIELANPQNITLDYFKSLTLFISPGDSLFIEFDKDFNTCLHSEIQQHIKFSGTRSAVSINSSLQKFKSFLGDKKFQPDCEGKSVEQYKSELSDWIENQKILLDRFKKKEKPDKVFINWAKYHNLYFNANYLVDYMAYLTMSNKYATEQGDLFDKKIFPVDNDRAINSSYYRVHLNQYLQFEYCRDSIFISASNNNDHFSAFDHAAGLILKNERQGISRDIMLCDLLTLCLDKDFTTSQKLKDIYLPKVSNDFLRSEITVQFNQTTENKSHPIEFRSLFNKNDTITGDLFDNIFSKFKGKVLYIDFWATWCGPCRVELPHSIKLNESYKGKNIEFIYICINSPKESWETAMKNLKHYSNQYYLDKVQSKLVTSKLQIRGLPRYFLINKKGEIINKNAPRPSTNEIENEIDILLKE